MDELFSLYTLLRGAEETSDKLDLSKKLLKKSLHAPGSFRRTFFDKVLECIQEMILTSSLEDASEYFGLPQDFLKVLFDPEAEFEYIEKLKQRFESEKTALLATSAVQSSLKTTALNLNYSAGSDVGNLADQNIAVPVPGILEANPQVIPPIDNIPVAANSIEPWSRLIVQPEDTNLFPSLNATQHRVQRFQSSTHKRKVDINNLSKHYPISGTIENPDYAFKLPSIT